MRVSWQQVAVGVSSSGSSSNLTYLFCCSDDRRWHVASSRRCHGSLADICSQKTARARWPLRAHRRCSCMRESPGTSCMGERSGVLRGHECPRILQKDNNNNNK